MNAGFLADFKRKTEARWASLKLNPNQYGFQFVPHTRWLPGLSEDQIRAYERDLNLVFPEDFRMLLRHLNGTNLETRDLHSGMTRVGVYSYPRDLDRVRGLMEEWRLEWPGVCDTYGLAPDDRCVPIFGHRGILCRKRGGSTPVFSLWGDDVIVYEEDLRSYLVREFLEDR